ncbi:MAG: FHA domain-containing protein [Lachnospiraceae bacterium]|jgi:hypothetical protein|nr:FHA domain-containing protein [Lachnospiraceae bacterium]
MERYAKGFRSFSGFLILLNLAGFFLPLTERTQEGYTPLRWSQFDYIKALLGGALPSAGEDTIFVSSTQTALILCCMVLPLILALAAGIWGIVGGPRQRVSSLLIFLVLILYLALYGFLDILWPEAQFTQTYIKGIACQVCIAVSGCSGAFGVLSLISTPKKVKKVEKKIPQLQEIRQQQAEAKYSIMMEKAHQDSQKTQSVKEPLAKENRPYVPGNPRGVMVGLSGVYAGAQIPMTDGEFIRLGRKNTNHLVFEGQIKVSRNHCRIKWDAADKKYIIYDYSNTGSFADGSHDCLPQNLNMPLEPGTVLAIGDDTNTFRLE